MRKQRANEYSASHSANNSQNWAFEKDSEKLTGTHDQKTHVNQDFCCVVRASQVGKAKGANKQIP